MKTSRDLSRIDFLVKAD